MFINDVAEGMSDNRGIFLSFSIHLNISLRFAPPFCPAFSFREISDFALARWFSVSNLSGRFAERMDRSCRYARAAFCYPLANRFGIQAWMLDVVTDALGSIGANGLAACLLFYAIHASMNR